MSEPRKPEVECPVCDRPWSVGCEQALSIEWHGACMVCRYRDHISEDASMDSAQVELAELAKGVRG